MQLARAVLPWDATESAVDDLLNRFDLDVLQLDFVWPQVWPCDVMSHENLLSRWATGFLAQAKIVHKSLFLRPELCVITNAGGGDTIHAMEALAAFFVEHGSSDLPVAAVRGDNLLSSLEWLPEAADLRDRQIFSAQAQLGGEPLATALVEGARIVLAGAYDSAAPFIAAAASRGLCSWHDVERLGKIAAASQFNRELVRITENGVEVEPSAPSAIERVRALGQSVHADVTCDYSTMSLTRRAGEEVLQIADVVASAGTATWKVRETYDAGYRGTALVGTHAQWVAEIQEFCSCDSAAEKCSVQVLSEIHAPDNCLVRVQWEANTVCECRACVGLLQSLLSQKAIGGFIEPLPSIVQLTETVEIAIPVDRLTLSVETRPASEWM